MVDQRTMAELLQAPTEGYIDAIVIPTILAENFEHKHDLLNLVTSKQFCGFEKEDPHAYIRWFNKITSMIKYKDMPNALIKLMLFSFSIEGVAWIWLEKEPPRSIVTWEYLVSKFINQFFPPSKPQISKMRLQIFSNDLINHSGNAGHCPSRVAHQVRPPGFSPAQNNQNRGNNYNSGNSTCRAPAQPTQAASFSDALLYMPNFASTFTNLLSNKDKLFELANTLMNENCSTVILKKLPEKLGDPGKFLIPFNFPKIVECLVLVDLGASINLMPLSIWRKLSLPKLTPTHMILELAERSTTIPTDIAEDVFVKVGKFHFLADLIVFDYVVDPRVPLILGRPFLRTARALIDVYGEELALRVSDEAITFKEYSQEVLGFSSNFESGNPTPTSEPIIAKSPPSLTPFEGGNFILEEIEAYLASDSLPPGIDDAEFNPEGDIHLIEEILNNDPTLLFLQRT
nr:reverse transcriptase domain-containing protein [Tanacetum cinerariifolium]